MYGNVSSWRAIQCIVHNLTSYFCSCIPNSEIRVLFAMEKPTTSLGSRKTAYSNSPRPSSSTSMAERRSSNWIAISGSGSAYTTSSKFKSPYFGSWLSQEDGQILVWTNWGNLPMARLCPNSVTMGRITHTIETGPFKDSWQSWHHTVGACHMWHR